MTALTKPQLRQIKKAKELSNQLNNLSKEISADRKWPAQVAETFRAHAREVELTARRLETVTT